MKIKMEINDIKQTQEDITKSYEKLGDTNYSRSMHDLLADIYVDLVKVNLCKPL